MKNNFKKVLSIFAIVAFATLMCGCVSDEIDKELKKIDDAIETEKDKKYSLGETFTFDDLEITLGDKITFTKVKNQFSEHNKKSVVKVPITVKNVKDETHSLNMFYYKRYGSQGVELDDVSAYFDDSVDYAGDLRTGASYTKYLYLLYDGDGTYAIEFDNWTTKITVEFEVKNK